jgi:CheY-like chemotaxis protein
MGAKGNKTWKYDSVLLIDDNEIDNFINERMIISNDFAREVIVKEAASPALDYLKDPRKDKPQLIFLDLNMPIMDGFGFLEEFDKVAKANPSLPEKTKIIVLSSSINPEDVDKASVNPYVYKYLNKPLSADYLKAINI